MPELSHGCLRRIEIKVKNNVCENRQKSVPASMLMFIFNDNVVCVGNEKYDIKTTLIDFLKLDWRMRKKIAHNTFFLTCTQSFLLSANKLVW